jgi:hypothetical protein
VGDAASFSESLPRSLQNRLQLWGVAHEQAFEIVFSVASKQNRDRLTLIRDDDRPLLGGLHVSGEIRRDFAL